jgi:hypothetical protein
VAKAGMTGLSSDRKAFPHTDDQVRQGGKRCLVGVAPSEYLARLEKGDPTTSPIPRDKLDGYLRSYLIDPELLRSDNFEGFIVDRQKQPLTLIEQATGMAAHISSEPEEGEEVGADEEPVEREVTVTAA